MTPLLSVDGLRTHVETGNGRIKAVDGVSFGVDRGETVCLVGESGSGKSVTCESLTGIVPQPPAEVVGGEITLDGSKLTDAGEGKLREIRGNRIAHVFQNPQGSLDPVYSIGKQVVEAITVHRDVSAGAARERAVDLLREVGIPDPADRIDEYPHEFSGGMQQRVALAIALAADPDLLVVDEPTTSLDVTVQARLIELLEDVAGEGTGLLWVTHDLRVVAAVADRVLVMFAGTIVERGPVGDVFATPGHPYTQALFASYRGAPGDAGSPAREEAPEDGCRFRDQCPHAVEACAGGDQPPFRPVAERENHTAACVYHGPERDAETVMADARGVARETAPGREDDP
ncbi:MAG: ABC transporter ATP-binding protein [Halobacteriales archaeon]